MSLLRSILAILLLLLPPSVAAQSQPSEIFKRGEAAIAARDYSLAVTEFTSYLQQMPKSSAAYFNRALAYKGLKNGELAIEDLTKAIELKPQDTKYYISRALAYKDLKRDDLSFADNSKVIELDPRNAMAYVNRGEIHYSRKQYDQALADADQAVRIDEKIAKAYWLRSNVNTIREDWRGAVGDLNKALALDPTQKNPWHLLAWMEMHIGNNSAAFAAAERFLDLNGIKHNRAAWTLVAGYLALLRDGKRDEAEKFIARYRREEAEGVLPAKVLEFLRGRLDEAELFAQAGDDPEFQTSVRSILGLKLLLDGKPDAAARHFSWVRDNGKKGPTTYALAIAELAKLTAKKM